MAALAIRDGLVPGTANLEAPEPELAALLPCLLHDPCEGRFERVLSTSFGFGGLNAALVLGSPST
jgi:3-oxoacyl-[acyl-carrier-protein] synthase II